MILVIMMPMVIASLIAPFIINTVALTPSAEFLLTQPMLQAIYIHMNCFCGLE